MKTGVNSVLWGGHPLDDAFAGASRAGYDGIELSAIPQMSEHLVLDRWVGLVGPIKELSDQYGLELLAMEQPSQDPEVMEQAFQAARGSRDPRYQLWTGREDRRRRLAFGRDRVAHQPGQASRGPRRDFVREGSCRSRHL